MRCTYPSCRYAATYIPVVEIPTVRTAGDSDELVATHRLTILVGQPLCFSHKGRFKFVEHFGTINWRSVRDEARARGVRLDPNVTVTWRPIGWTPDKRYLEIER